MSNILNLYDEIAQKLEKAGRAFKDIEFVTFAWENYSWKEFEPIARSLSYDVDKGLFRGSNSGFLQIVGDDWSLEKTIWNEKEEWVYEEEGGTFFPHW